ncbi:YdcF family protein [Metabacillus niabensis]|nr:multidrug MFS transporter [Bacillus sp. 7586-K]
MIKKRICRIVAVMFVMLVLYFLWTAISIWSFANKMELEQSDAAAVLGAAAWGDKPSPVFRERINHAIWLYENGYVSKLIFTGGKGNGAKYAESEVAKIYAIKQGVRENDILIETNSKMTEENLEEVKKIAINEEFKTLTIVSDPLHMKRAMAIAHHLDLKVNSSPTQTSVYKTLKTKGPFLIKETFYYIGYKLFTLY